ncbi:MAG: tetratricopeptide repeat protein [Bacteroidia bacterium]
MQTDRIQQLEKFLEEDANDAFTLYALALEYIKVHALVKAKEFFSILYKLHPGYLPLYYQFGNLLATLNEKEKANELYNKGIALAKNKNDIKTLNELKEAYNSLNGIEED